MSTCLAVETGIRWRGILGHHARWPLRARVARRSERSWLIG
jgi:hypothetical protein